jgi:hypothetical protein
MTAKLPPRPCQYPDCKGLIAEKCRHYCNTHKIADRHGAKGKNRKRGFKLIEKIVSPRKLFVRIDYAAR